MKPMVRPQEPGISLLQVSCIMPALVIPEVTLAFQRGTSGWASRVCREEHGVPCSSSRSD